MDRIQREATQLLNEYKPKEALEKLSGLQKKSEQSLQLTENCKILLRQQLLYLLKEANNSNDYEEMEVYISEYKRFLGMDEYCEVYDDKVTLHKNLVAQTRYNQKKEQLELERKKKARKETMYSYIGNLAFILTMAAAIFFAIILSF